MSDRWLDSKKHEPPTGVVIEGLWKPLEDHNGHFIRGWIRHDVVRCSKGEYHVIGSPVHGLCTSTPPVHWRIQQDVPAPPLDG